MIAAAHLAFTRAQGVAMLACVVFAVVVGGVIAWRALAPDHPRERTPEG